MYECFHCCTRSVVRDADFTFEDYGIEGEGLIHHCHCTHCGAEHEIYVPITEDDVTELRERLGDHMSDLISRADAICEVLVNDGMDNIVDRINALPSADAVHGEWEDMEIQCNPYPPIFCVECSACGYRVGRETFLENTFNFCPNCGARMKGGTE